MKKIYVLGISLLLLSLGGCGKPTDKENKSQDSDEPWITLDKDTIESDENGQFQLTGKAKYSSFSASIIQNKNGLSLQEPRGVLKIEKDGSFIWKNIFINGQAPTTDVSFSTYKEKEKIQYQVNVDYSKFVAKQEENRLIEEEINATMPALLEEIIASSESMIINIDKKYHSYRSLLVTVPLDVKYERNGMKKKYMDTIGFLIQDKTASTLYPDKKQIPYITFRYDKTNEVLGATDLINRRKFILYDESN
ncbi:hypothetical protein BCR22_03555 [Enterococcus plantarum]|uniref:hypothetical protein n=1 Tax=Enterococcus TaxID=1350 RepID=UPI00084D38CE|nr:hypothetical protein [Enterococcus plantarum]OEG13329.1 hypothetical protein BCR22_03555 [Enterococcus plantarum]